MTTTAYSFVHPGIEEPRIERLRRLIEERYLDHPTGTGGSFGEILCHEIHEEGQTFIWLAEKWGISLPTLGELIHDHCKRLEDDPTFAVPEPAVPETQGHQEQRALAAEHHDGHRLCGCQSTNPEKP